MTEDRPLHVRVAEALNWRALECRLDGNWWGIAPWMEGEPAHVGRLPVPRYDTDWSATGPLIEKYGVTVTNGWGKSSWAALTHFEPELYEGIDYDEAGEGGTPLEAICHLLLALHEAGKLKGAK